MLVFAIILVILVLIAFLRFAIIIEYNETGLQYWGKAGFIKFNISNVDKEKKVKRKKEIKKQEDSIKKQLMPGSFSEFMDILKVIRNILDRLRRRLLIKQLTIHYVSAGEDPAATALKFGTANVVFNTVIPLLEKFFRIKRKDLSASADFNTVEQKIYLKAVISLAVWEMFYIISALFPLISGVFKKLPKPETSKQLN